MSVKVYRIDAADNREQSVSLPSSKSVSHRICILGGLNTGETHINELLDSEDIDLTLQALENMGMGARRNNGTLICQSPIGHARADKSYLGNSGSSARFLMPLPAFTDRTMCYYGDERLHQRPFSELFDALSAVGIKIDSDQGSLPANVHPGPVKGGQIQLEKLPSSQIISGLMMAALWMERDLTIRLEENTPSLPYIEMTYNLMRHLNLQVEYIGNEMWVKAQRPNYEWHFTVEKDLSASSYWVAYALITGQKVTLSNVTLPSLQGDEKIFRIAEDAGATVTLFPDRVEIEGAIRKGFSANCLHTPDLVPALAVIGMFAPEAVHLHGVENLRFKECDRIAAIQENIATLGGKTEFDGDTLTILPQKKYRGGLMQSYNDHRIAMSFAIAGSRIPDVLIENPDCVNKSYPAFWTDFSAWKQN